MNAVGRVLVLVMAGAFVAGVVGGTIAGAMRQRETRRRRWDAPDNVAGAAASHWPDQVAHPGVCDLLACEVDRDPNRRRFGPSGAFVVCSVCGCPPGCHRRRPAPVPDEVER